MTPDMQGIKALDRKGLRQFALVTGSVVPGLFGFVLPWLFGVGAPIWPWIAGGALWLAGLTVPMALQPVYRVWMKLGLVLSRITTPIIMGLVFFLVVTPTGLLRRVFAEDPLAREFNDDESYRKRSSRPKPRNMDRPF